METHLQDVTVQVDPDQIRQVLVNLLRNAWAAAGRGGTVRVTIQQGADAPELRVWDSAGSIRPGNLGQASRISGISPADLAVVLMYLEGR